jgi:transcriptional regulator with XRE-family HTH domain
MERPPATTYLVNGTAVRTRRKELGLKQVDCATRAGISSGYLRQLELGFRHTLRPPTYMALRTALQLTSTDRRLLAPSEEQHRKE